jgi:hypothetical protein
MAATAVAMDNSRKETCPAIATGIGGTMTKARTLPPSNLCTREEGGGILSSLEANRQ